MRYAAPWVVLVAIALAFGFIWGRRSGLAEGEVALDSRPAEVASAFADDRAAPVQAPIAPPSAVVTRLNGSTPTAPSRLRSPTATNTMERAPEAQASVDASGVLTGRVTWTDKSPLAGAIVVAEPDEPWNLMVTRDRPIDGTLYRPDPALAAVNVRRRSNWLATNRLETTTDADGRFRFEGLDARRRHWVSAYAAGAEIDGSGGRFTQSACGIDLALTAVPVAAVAFILRLPDGSEPDAAIVDDRPAESSSAACKRNWFRDSPSVTLKKGKRTVCIWTEVGAEVYVSSSIEVEVTDSGPSEPIDVKLEPRFAITGRLVIPAGELLVGNAVLIMKYKDAGPPDDDRMRADAEPVAIDMSTGAFRLRPVQPGRHAVMVVDACGVTRHRAVVDVVDRSVDIEIALSPAPASMYIRIKVLANDGSPVTDVEVRDRETSTKAVLQPDGNFVLSRHQVVDTSSRRRDGGPRLLRAASSTFGKIDVEYAPETDQDLVLRFRAPAVLRLELVGKRTDEEGRYDCYLTGTRHYEDLEPEGAARSAFVSGNLQPGDYCVFITRRSGDCSIQFSEEICIVSGENRHVVSLPENVTLHVDLSELTDVTRIDIERIDTNGESARCLVSDSSVSDSLRTYSGLVAGRYTAQAVDADGDTVPFDFDIGGNTTVRFRKGKADSARIIYPGKALAEHGIVAGDILYGFGDLEWSANPANAIEACNSFQGSLELRVRRNGRDLRIQAAASAVASARWTPCIR